MDVCDLSLIFSNVNPKNMFPNNSWNYDPAYLICLASGKSSENLEEIIALNGKI